MSFNHYYWLWADSPHSSTNQRKAKREQFKIRAANPILLSQKAWSNDGSRCFSVWSMFDALNKLLSSSNPFCKEQSTPRASRAGMQFNTYTLSHIPFLKRQKHNPTWVFKSLTYGIKIQYWHKFVAFQLAHQLLAQLNIFPSWIKSERRNS